MSLLSARAGIFQRLLSLLSARIRVALAGYCRLEFVLDLIAVVARKIQARHRPHIADLVCNKNSASSTQVLVAQIKRCLISTETT
jgi:hypothetical protein